jgi:hypothetical protein
VAARRRPVVVVLARRVINSGRVRGVMVAKTLVTRRKVVKREDKVVGRRPNPVASNRFDPF